MAAARVETPLPGPEAIATTVGTSSASGPELPRAAASAGIGQVLEFATDEHPSFQIQQSAERRIGENDAAVGPDKSDAVIQCLEDVCGDCRGARSLHE